MRTKKEKDICKNPRNQKMPCESDRKDGKQKSKLDRNHKGYNENILNMASTTSSTTSTPLIRAESSSDISVRRDPMHFNSYYSSFDDPEIPSPFDESKSSSYKPGMSSIESISQDISSSTVVSSSPNTDGLSVLPKHEGKRIQQTSNHHSAEGPQLMTWVSNKLTDMKTDIIATGISEKIGANSAVNSCGDGALSVSLISNYSSTVRISQLDLDEVSSDEEIAIEVEYVPKNIGLEDTESQACNLLRTMHPGAIPQRTGESFFAVSPNVSAFSSMNTSEIN